MFFIVEVDDGRTNNNHIPIGFNLRYISEISKEGDNKINFFWSGYDKFPKSFSSEAERDTYFNYMVGKLEVLSLTKEKTCV